ncbi:hypothetical protein DW097_15700 [Enterocloster clostridioformis]|jgi:hypothetical protein|nr:hypothetical protein DW097_15700 [Enterocloster clostridioformis]RGC24631.1 hypothetical protein DWX59_19915 [Enterocloster aldenensis]
MKMKFTYPSKRDFERNCPCSQFIESYARSISPRSAVLDFCMGHQSIQDEKTYFATYDVFLANNQGHYRLEVSCTILPNRNYSYKTISKSEIHQ